ncbi:Gp49 family protein [Photobacterium damselae]|uniref:Gp49 family protein n=1 Tax=Photobacterium damselae TaxID=38293 RepID=UPI001FF7633E|nr:Gp49 family protein [Photobacterium damselae]
MRQIRGNTMTKVEYSHIKNLLNSLEYKFERVGETTVTGCWAFLPNGFQVGYGESACVDPSNYNQADGEKYAKERCQQAATNKLWELEGYLLKVIGVTSDQLVKSVEEIAQSSTAGMVSIENVMQKYKCSKVVSAAEIVSVASKCEIDGSLSLIIADPENEDLRLPYLAHSDLTVRYKPQVGDYIIMYSGGYISISPKEEFERGYSLIDDI